MVKHLQMPSYSTQKHNNGLNGYTCVTLWLFRSMKQDQFNAKTNTRVTIGDDINNTGVIDFETANYTKPPFPSTKELPRVGHFYINITGIPLTAIITYNV